jgi:hypothetical protein
MRAKAMWFRSPPTPLNFILERRCGRSIGLRSVGGSFFAMREYHVGPFAAS